MRQNAASQSSFGSKTSDARSRYNGQLYEDFFIEVHQKSKKRWCDLLSYGMQTKEFRPLNPDEVSDLILYYDQGLRMWSRVICFDGQEADHYVSTVRRLVVAP